MNTLPTATCANSSCPKPATVRVVTIRDHLTYGLCDRHFKTHRVFCKGEGCWSHQDIEPVVTDHN